MSSKRQNPLPPTFTNIPSATNKEKINVTGFASQGVTVKLFVNGPEVAETIADASGKFEFSEIDLIKGRNSLSAKSIGNKNLESEKSQTIHIEFDSEEPELEIIEPENDKTITNLNNRIQITGTVDEKSTITINDKNVILKPNLTFEFLLGVEEGETIIKIKALDEAGNEEVQELKVFYKKG